MKKTMDAKIKQQFKEIHNLDVEILKDHAIVFLCHKYSNGEKVKFIGKVKDGELYLPIEYPYNPDENICSCAETGISPDVEDPHAYYIFEDYLWPTGDELDKWCRGRKKFISDLEQYKEQEQYKERALHACRVVLDGIIDSKYDMSVDWENIFLGAYNDYGKTGNKG